MSPKSLATFPAMIRTSRVTALDIAAFVVGLLLLVSLLSGGALAPRPAQSGSAPDLPEESGVVRLLVDRATIPTGVAPHFAQWEKSATYHGAFALGSDGSFGWVERYNTPAMARAAALAYCGQHAADCQIIATSWPSEPAAGGFALTARNRAHLARHLEHPGFAAFAVSENGASGWSSDFDTEVEARVRALFECSSANQGQPEFLPPAPCVVISVKAPGG